MRYPTRRGEVMSRIADIRKRAAEVYATPTASSVAQITHNEALRVGAAQYVAGAIEGLALKLAEELDAEPPYNKEANARYEFTDTYGTTLQIDCAESEDYGTEVCEIWSGTQRIGHWISDDTAQQLLEKAREQYRKENAE